MAWPNLGWDNPADYRSVADQIAYRTYSFRDMSKKLGHGSNYYGQPPTMAMHAKLPVRQVQDFQDAYFGAFPCIPEWHKWTIDKLQTTRILTHLFGRRRTFFGDVKDQNVINAAIAYSPQGMTGEEINRGILNLWYDPRFELMVQVHDSILFQVDYKDVNTLVPLALQKMEVHRRLKGGRDFYVPLEAEVGFNWGKAKESNPHGMKTWSGEETRKPPKQLMQKRIGLFDM
jgi:DNA polymerase I-like protein with 3'-5' exonuclease and polymerase domains